VKSCVFHYECMHLRPFGRGSGKVARMWHTLLLYKWGMSVRLPLADAIYERRDTYFTALATSDEKNGLTLFVELMMQLIKTALNDFERNLVN